MSKLLFGPSRFKLPEMTEIKLELIIDPDM